MAALVTSSSGHCICNECVAFCAEKLLLSMHDRERELRAEIVKKLRVRSEHCAQAEGAELRIAARAIEEETL